MKKVLNFVLGILIIASVLMILSITALAATDGYYTYTVSNGVATITDCDTSISGNITIPASLGGYTVEKIGEDAFCECNSLTGVTLPNTITTIEFRAFYRCEKLKSISMPNSVKKIGLYAFSGCESLIDITIPSSVTKIGSGAFDSCPKLNSIKVENTNTNYCDVDGNLYNKQQTILIRYAIGKTASHFSIPNTVKSIEDDAFRDCVNLKNIIIPNTVITIGDSAFSGCKELENINIPNSVTTIGFHAFVQCYKLEKIEIPSSVQTIDRYAFSFCDSLVDILVDDNNENYCDINGVLYNKNKSLLIQYPSAKIDSTYVVPSTVTIIENKAFENCSNLKNITIPNTVMSIGESAFYHCSSLTDIIIPEGVSGIGDYTFSGCLSLTSITIPKSVTSVGDLAFNGCRNLKKVDYDGDFNNWNGISIGKYNENLVGATIRYICYIDFYEANGNLVLRTTNERDAALDLINIPKKSGYTTKLYTDSSYMSALDATMPITSNTNLYVAYEVNQYTYKFLDEDGSILKEETVDYGTVILPPENPSKERTQKYTYTFAEWSGFSDGLTQEDRQMVFTAKYKETINQYTYKFLDEDGGILKEETVDYGTIIISPEISDKTEYYLFDYWQGYTEGMTLTGDITFTAVYKYKDYTITVEGLVGTINITYNDYFNIKPQAKEGYSFVGYFNEKDGKGMQITNEKGDSLFVYNVVGNSKVYPYFYSNYMNKVELQCVKSATPGDTITQKAIFATDKDATYFITTVKYPKHLKLKSVKGVDFKEATVDPEKVIGDYKYLDVTCVFDYEGNFAEINTNYIPFEIKFDIATDIPEDELNMSFEISLENVILIGENTFEITDIKNHTITILPKLAESIEIIGITKIDKATQFKAVVSPDYTTDTSVVWSIDNETVATICQDGTVTPIKQGTVTITATAKDGSEVFATKTVDIIVYAKINSLDFECGVALTEFSPDVRKYTVYVKENTTSISLTPTFSDGILKANGSSLWVSGRSKDFELQENGTTTITLNRENVTDMTNSIYTVEVIKFEGIKTEVSENKRLFDITPINVETGKTVILALYNGELFVEMQSAVYTGEEISFTTTKGYSNAKVMVWDNLTNLKPVYGVEVVK